jgi:hypothetical protein
MSTCMGGGGWDHGMYKPPSKPITLKPDLFFQHVNMFTAISTLDKLSIN